LPFSLKLAAKKDPKKVTDGPRPRSIDPVPSPNPDDEYRIALIRTPLLELSKAFFESTSVLDWRQVTELILSENEVWIEIDLFNCADLITLNEQLESLEIPENPSKPPTNGEVPLGQSPRSNRFLAF